MGSRCNCTWILGLPGFRVERIERKDAGATSRLRVFVERCGRRYPCSGCGRRTTRVQSTKDRTWDDLPWAAHPVTLVYRQRRVSCRRCGIRTERIEFADAKARVTRRLRQQIGVDCQSMPTSHAAVRHGVSLGESARRKPFSPSGIRVADPGTSSSATCERSGCYRTQALPSAA